MYLGLDIGTSGVKALLIDAKHKIVATTNAKLSVSRPQSGWSEQNPEDWWQAVTKAILALKRQQPKALAAVEGIGLSGQQHGATLLDKHDKVLRPAILWNDARAFREGREIEERVPNSREISGNIAMAGFTAPKLVWVKKHEPRIFAKVAKVLLPKDYVRLRLTGEYATDMSDAGGTLWMDVAKREWSDILIEATDLTRDHMPKLFEGTDATGRLRDELAKTFGMPKKPVVAGGGGDNAASACGIGAVTDGATSLSIGTSGVMFVSNDRFSPNTGRAIHAMCHAVPDTWHQMGVILSAAGSLEWLAGFLRTPAPKLVGALGEKLTGPSPAIFQPYLSGERTPHNDAEVRGGLFGIGYETDASIATHAVLDAVAFAFRDTYEALKDAGTKVERAMAVGGGSKSKLWLKIIATALGIEITLPAAGDFGGAFGAARLGLIAATGADYRDVLKPPKVIATVKPDPKLRAAYDDAYGRYTRGYKALKEVMSS
ncbi:xylulokinase [soil metagenome]